MAFEKVLLQSFPSIEGLSMLQFQKPTRMSMEVPSYPRSQMTKRNSSKKTLVLWLPSPEISHPQVVLALELQEERVHSRLVLYL